MNNKNQNTGAAVVVPGFYHTSLSTLRCIRSLKKQHVQIWSVGPESKKSPGYYSNIPDVKIVYTESEGLINALLRIKDRFSEPPALLLTTDQQVVEISRDRLKLQDHYRFLLPSEQLVDSLMEKTRFTQLALAKGWDIPRSLEIKDETMLCEAGKILNYPFILKPFLMHAFRINNNAELERAVEKMIPVNYQAMLVQEWIEGGDDQLFFCFMLFDHHSKPVHTMMARKLRQWPVSDGTTSLCVTCADDELVQKSVTLFQSLGYQGFCSIEYKYDSVRKKYYIMEPTLGRFDLQIALTRAAGVNFPLALYRLLTEAKPVQARQKDGVYWIFETHDLYSKIKTRPNKYAFWGNFFKKHARVLFEWMDPLPLAADMISTGTKILKK